MPEPAIDPDWNNLNFRRNALPASGRSDAATYFALGVTIFLVTALVYPWYAYRVHSKLAQWELEAAVQASTAALKSQLEASRQETASVRRAAAASSLQERLRGVVVTGTSVIRGQRLVIVSLGSASLQEAVPTICRQAERRFAQPLAGERLRIQLQSGRQPARDAGSLSCP